MNLDLVFSEVFLCKKYIRMSYNFPNENEKKIMKYLLAIKKISKKYQRDISRLVSFASPRHCSFRE